MPDEISSFQHPKLNHVLKVLRPTQEEKERLAALTLLMGVFDLPFKVYLPEDPVSCPPWRLHSNRPGVKAKRRFETLDELEAFVHNILNEPELLDANQRLGGRIASSLETRNDWERWLKDQKE